MNPTKKQVFDALRSIPDPELGVDLVELGLIRDADLTQTGRAIITYTLTQRGCPMKKQIAGEITRVLAELGFSEVQLSLVFDPPWDPSQMSEDAKIVLGATLPTTRHTFKPLPLI